MVYTRTDKTSDEVKLHLRHDVSQLLLKSAVATTCSSALVAAASSSSCRSGITRAIGIDNLSCRDALQRIFGPSFWGKQVIRIENVVELFSRASQFNVRILAAVVDVHLEAVQLHNRKHRIIEGAVGGVTEGQAQSASESLASIIASNAMRACNNKHQP